MTHRFFREWLPPRLQEWARARFGHASRVAVWPDARAEGWQAAAAQAATDYGEGARRMSEGKAMSFLAEEEPAGWWSQDPQFHHRMLQFCLVAARLRAGNRDSLRILDFGGRFGLHARALARLLPALQFDYTVCELPAHCSEGQHLNPEVRFVSSLAEAGTGYDLVYASASVQYSHDWRELVSQLCQATRRAVFVTRTPFVRRSPSFVVVERAYSTCYPGWVFNYEEFVRAVEGSGVLLSEVMLNGRGLAVRGAPEPNMHLGLVFERARDTGHDRA